MSLDWERLGSEGIRFFGRLGVSAARDMARILADISRQAEQLEEMVEAAERGVAPSTNRLATLADRLATKATQAEAALDRVRKVAAAAESPVGLVNVSEIALRMVQILKPRAERRRIGLVIKGAEVPAYAASNVFFLQNLLYLALEKVLEPGSQGPVEVLVRQEENGSAVEIHVPRPVWDDPALREKLTLLARSLEADIILDGNRMLLRLPSRGRLIQALRGDRESEPPADHGE